MVRSSQTGRRARPAVWFLAPVSLAAVLLGMAAVLLGPAAPAAAYTRAQATAGERTFSRHCIECHGLGGVGDSGPTLRGPNFARRWPAVEDTAMFIRNRMPPEEQGILTNQQVYEVLAYFLSLRQVPADDQPLTPVTARVQTWPPDLAFMMAVAATGGSHGNPAAGVTVQGEATPVRQIAATPDDAQVRTEGTPWLMPALWGLGLTGIGFLAWKMFAR